MIVDGRTLPAGTTLAADLCIVGAGPAAIALALEFAHSPLSVILIDGGDVVPQEQSLENGRAAKGSAIGNVTEFATGHMVGGNAHHWDIQTGRTRRGVRLVPLQDIDFAERDWMEMSGWPLKPRDLDVYYARAYQVFGVPPEQVQVKLEHKGEPASVAQQMPEIEDALFHFGNGDLFLNAHLKAIAQSANITLYHHTTALEIDANAEASHIERIRFATAPQSGVSTVSARHFVLASGGFGSARLLLASTGSAPSGLGNAHDNVGRYLMDHPLLHGGSFTPSSPQLFDAASFYDMRLEDGTAVMGHLRLKDEVIRREKVLNISALLFPRPAGYQVSAQMSPRRQQALFATGRLRRAVRTHTPVDKADLWTALKGADGIALRLADRVRSKHATISRGGWSKLGHKSRRFQVFAVTHQVEQAPHRDNRIYLSEERDPFGQRRISVDWTWHKEDVDATVRAQEIMAQAFSHAGLGQFKIARDAAQQPVVLTSSTSHYMGTTRMDEDPKRGVVDANCRVHGTDNLFVASSSVFPTGGYANPTLTIAALAIRLADYLKTTLEFI